MPKAKLGLCEYLPCLMGRLQSWWHKTIEKVLPLAWSSNMVNTKLLLSDIIAHRHLYRYWAIGFYQLFFLFLPKEKWLWKKIHENVIAARHMVPNLNEALLTEVLQLLTLIVGPIYACSCFGMEWNLLLLVQFHMAISLKSQDSLQLRWTLGHSWTQQCGSCNIEMVSCAYF